MHDENAFAKTLTRAVGLLYKAHPKTIDIGSDELTNPPIQRNILKDHEAVKVPGGTLTWLYRNGFVTGNYNLMNDGSAIIIEAQLSSVAYVIASKQWQGRTIGRYAVSILSEAPGSREESVVSELVARHMTEG